MAIVGDGPQVRRSAYSRPHLGVRMSLHGQSPSALLLWLQPDKSYNSNRFPRAAQGKSVNDVMFFLLLSVWTFGAAVGGKTVPLQILKSVRRGGAPRQSLSFVTRCVLVPDDPVELRV
jgi:hypothetical protein